MQGTLSHAECVFLLLDMHQCAFLWPWDLMCRLVVQIAVLDLQREFFSIGLSMLLHSQCPVVALGNAASSPEVSEIDQIAVHK